MNKSTPFQRDSRREGPPAHELDVVDEAVSPPTGDDFLDEFNIGLGNYDSKEYWQQVQSFQKGLYADAGFSRRIIERAIEETKYALAVEGWTFTDENDAGEPEVKHDFPGWEELTEGGNKPDDLADRPDGPGPYDRRQWVAEKGEERWAALTREQKLAALEEKTGITKGWTPPHWRMIKMRHEASRSRGARLLDNLFGRIKKVLTPDSDSAKDEVKLDR